MRRTCRRGGRSRGRIGRTALGQAAPASGQRPRTRSLRPRQAEAARESAPRARSIPSGRTRLVRSASRCSRQWPSSWAIVNLRRAGHWRASSALTQISPRAGSSRPDSAWPVPSSGAPGAVPRSSTSRTSSPTWVSAISSIGTGRRLAVPHVGRDPGRGTPRRAVRSPPSAAMVIAAHRPRGRASPTSVAYARRRDRRRDRERPLSLRAISSTSRQSPACDGMAHERRWVVGVWHGRSSRGSSAAGNLTSAAAEQLDRPRPTHPVRRLARRQRRRRRFGVRRGGQRLRPARLGALDSADVSARPASRSACAVSPTICPSASSTRSETPSAGRSPCSISW